MEKVFVKNVEKLDYSVVEDLIRQTEGDKIFCGMHKRNIEFFSCYYSLVKEPEGGLAVCINMQPFINSRLRCYKHKISIKRWLQ